MSVATRATTKAPRDEAAAGRAETQGSGLGPNTRVKAQPPIMPAITPITLEKSHQGSGPGSGGGGGQGQRLGTVPHQPTNAHKTNSETFI